MAASPGKAAYGFLNFTVETNNLRFKKIRKANTKVLLFLPPLNSEENVSHEDRVMGLCSPFFYVSEVGESKGNGITGAESYR